MLKQRLTALAALALAILIPAITHDGTASAFLAPIGLTALFARSPIASIY